MLHIYYGNGKGKTTAAIGLTIRAVGAGMKAAFFQFLKNGSSSEINILRNIGNIHVMCCEKCNKFTYAMNEFEKKEVTLCHNEMLKKGIDLLKSGEIQLVVLDEFLDACNKKLIDHELCNLFLDHWTDKAEIIITGRDPSQSMINKADYITEMKAVKHPFNRGLSARKGIEY